MEYVLDENRKIKDEQYYIPIDIDIPNYFLPSFEYQYKNKVSNIKYEFKIYVNNNYD